MALLRPRSMSAVWSRSGVKRTKLRRVKIDVHDPNQNLAIRYSTTSPATNRRPPRRYATARPSPQAVSAHRVTIAPPRTSAATATPASTRPTIRTGALVSPACCTVAAASTYIRSSDRGSNQNPAYSWQLHRISRQPDIPLFCPGAKGRGRDNVSEMPRPS
jgi:hypothetical protein